MPVLDLADVTLYYQFDPADSRPVLVLSNSLGTNLSMWSPQVNAFSQHFSLLRYDARGQGRSSIPPAPYTVSMMGNDVLALLDACGLDRVYFCGLSMGGMVGQWLGIHAPQRLHRLVLSNTASKIGITANWNQRIENVQQNGMESIIPTLLKAWFTEAFRNQHPAEMERIHQMLAANVPAGYIADCTAVRDMDQRSEIATITAPTLVISGTHDISTPPSEAEFLAAHIPGAQLVELDAAHISNIEASAAFTETVLRFLLEGEQ